MTRTWGLVTMGVVFGAGLAAAAEAPVGMWKTIDEKSGRVVSEVQITEQAGKLTGTITGLTEPTDKAGKPKTCTACKGDDKDKPIIGLVIIPRSGAGRRSLQERNHPGSGGRKDLQGGGLDRGRRAEGARVSRRLLQDPDVGQGQLMRTSTRTSARAALAGLCVVALATIAGLGGVRSSASADEADARNLFKAMSDYMAAQKAISFQYDTNLEIVTKDQQKLALASSGTITLNRPDKIRVTRTGGFADVEFLFDGKTLTLLGKTANLYGQLEVPGTIDHLIDELRDKYGKPVPGADLLLSNINDALMATVVDVKDLGSGVIGGVECDHLAFRTNEVDWQIWIAQGDRPYPCRYVITSSMVDQAPQYSIDDQGLENRRRGWGRGFQLQECNERQKDGSGRSPRHG